MKTPHKHKDLIIAWANGAEIEYFSNAGAGWRPTTIPNWADNYEFRIKPELKPDVVEYVNLGRDSLGLTFTHRLHQSNLRITFCGETGKLKSAEVL